MVSSPSTPTDDYHSISTFQPESLPFFSSTDQTFYFLKAFSFAFLDWEASQAFYMAGGFSSFSSQL